MDYERKNYCVEENFAERYKFASLVSLYRLVIPMHSDHGPNVQGPVWRRCQAPIGKYARFLCIPFDRQAIRRLVDLCFSSLRNTQSNYALRLHFLPSRRSLLWPAHYRAWLTQLSFRETCGP